MRFTTRFWLTLALCLLSTVAQTQLVFTPGFNPDDGAITDQRWKSGVPLGGIGVGKVELLTDGSFGNFTTNHNWDRPYGWAKGAFAAVWARSEGQRPVARMLRLAGPNEYPGVTNVTHTQMFAWFPRADLVFADTALPIRVRLDAFSPLIPHNVTDSSLPIATLTYTLTNPTRDTVQAAVLLSWPNLLGWGGRKNVEWNDLTGNRQDPLTTRSLAGLRYTTSQRHADDRQSTLGELFVGARLDHGVEVTTANWDAAAPTPAFWSAFAVNGNLTSGAASVPPTPLLAAGRPASDVATQPAGAVAAHVTLAPGQVQTLHFYVTWAMPHHITIQQRTVYSTTAAPHFTGLKALFDGDPATQWSTGRPMMPGDHLLLDLGAPVTATKVVLESSSKPQNTPHGLHIEVSRDRREWRQVAHVSATRTAELAASGGVMEVSLQAVPARYLRITNLGADNTNPWSIDELKVYAQGHDEPVRVHSAIAFLVHSTLRTVTEDLGHYWQNAFHSAAAITAYADANFDRLLRDTRAWQDPVRASNLPFWLKLKLINCAFPLFTNTVLTQDGRFAVLESPVDMRGALGTMDQRLASHAFYTAFFPELDRAELELFATCQQPDGRITHFDGNVHAAIGRPDVNYGITNWPDLSCSWVMQVAKLARWSGDHAFLDRMWPHVKTAMAWLAAADRHDEAIPEGGSTYDYELPTPGAFIYSASCYLGALRAAAAIAAVERDSQAGGQYADRLDQAQSSVLTNLWNGTYFRKSKSLATGTSNENSFVANLAGDWMARLTGLPRTLPRDIVHRAIAQTIARHQKTFFPVPAMEVTPDGQAATLACYLLQQEPYLGCEAIYENYVDDGLETLRRVYLCAWEMNHSPWDESLGYALDTGAQGGLHSYMTATTSWHVLDALAGASCDLGTGTLYLSPRLPTTRSELHMPVYLSRFWGWLDYVPADHRLTLRIDRVFAPENPAADPLFRLPNEQRPGADSVVNPIVLRAVVSDVDSPALALPEPFTVRPHATLDLSSLIDRMRLPESTEVVNFVPKGF